MILPCASGGDSCYDPQKKGFEGMIVVNSDVEHCQTNMARSHKEGRRD